MRSTVWRRALALAGVALILSTTAALADQVLADSDVVTAAVQNNPIVVNLAPSGSTTITAGVEIKSQGSTHVSFPVSITVTTENISGTTVGDPTSSPISVTAYGDAGEATTTFNVTAPVAAALVCGTNNLFQAKLHFTAASSTDVFSGGNNTDFVTANVNVQGPACTSSNNPPVVDAGGPYAGNEGSDIALDGGSASDSDGTIASTVWSIVDDSGVSPGSCSLKDASSLTGASISCTDNGSVTVRLTATDDDGASSQDDATVDVSNVAPDITTFSCPVDPVAVNTSVTLSGAFTDAGTADTHTASFAWGDTLSDPGAVTETDGSGTVSGSHTYTGAGIYTPTLTVNDDDNGSDSASCQYVVVYDPSAGFVTGGGWIMSPLGAYVADATLTGKATFGFVSKYQKGANVPTGNTEFQFQAGGLNFKSSSYDWLVVQGQSKASYKGTGTINGNGSYGFLLSVIDNGSSGDAFRIKIWDKLNGDAVVYDNQLGAADDASASTVIGGGSIVIHTK